MSRSQGSQLGDEHSATVTSVRSQRAEATIDSRGGGLRKASLGVWVLVPGGSSLGRAEETGVEVSSEIRGKCSRGLGRVRATE